MIGMLIAIKSASAAMLAATCICGEAPEREHDFYWENDKVGFRAYGPGEFHKWSGIDVFNKGDGENAVVKLLRERGHGAWHHLATVTGVKCFDNYTIGASRGCGGIAFWGDGEWKTYPDWQQCEVIHQGDDYLEFKLVYAAFAAAGRMTCHVTMRRGERFFRNEVSFEKKFLFDFAAGPGLDLDVRREHGGDVFESAELGIVSVFENAKRDQSGNDEGSTMTAIIAEDPAAVEFRTDHQGCRVMLCKKNRFAYWAGASWSGAGEITTPAAWHEEVRRFAKVNRNQKRE